MADWTLSPGDTIKRTELHRLFGGSRQSGISPSAQSPNVFFFSDPASGEQHGYFDDWNADGCFHYTGEGQHGDQLMIKGNLAILEAAQDVRTLRGFKGTGGEVSYQGRFELDTDDPWYTRDATETGGGPIRTVIVFRLRPIDIKPGPARGLALTTRTIVRTVPVEERNTERMVVEPSRQPYEAERRESALVQRFKVAMEKQGHRARRLEIIPPGEVNSLFTDLYFEDKRLLVEAKGGVDRNSIRMGIGQLMDYRRFVNPKPRCAILLPSRPREDLVQLLAYAGIVLYYPNGEAFDAVQPVKAATTHRPGRRSLYRRDSPSAG
jgi:hypothetical protein